MLESFEQITENILNVYTSCVSLILELIIELLLKFQKEFFYFLLFSIYLYFSKGIENLFQLVDQIFNRDFLKGGNQCLFNLLWR